MASQDVRSSEKDRLLGKAVSILSIALLKVAIEPIRLTFELSLLIISPLRQQNQASVWVAYMIYVRNTLGQLARLKNLLTLSSFLAKTLYILLT